MKILLELDKKGRYDKIGGRRINANGRNTVRGMGEAELEQLINDGLENYSPTNAEQITRRYCKLKFKNGWKYLQEMYPLIIENLKQYGAGDSTNNSNFWKFLVQANDKINFPISPAQGQVLYSCFGLREGDANYVDPDTDFLYDQRAYSSLAKLKSCIFLNDKDNVASYGLYKDEAKTKPLTVEDIIDITNDRVLANTINSAQKEFPESRSGSASRGRTMSLITALAGNFPDRFPNTVSSRTLDVSELKAFVLDTIKESDKASLLPTLRTLDRDDENYKDELVTFVSNQKVNIGATKGDLKDYLIDFVDDYITGGFGR